MNPLFPRFQAALRRATDEILTRTALRDLLGGVRRGSQSSEEAQRQLKRAAAATRQASRAAGSSDPQSAEAIRSKILDSVTRQSGFAGELIKALLRPRGEQLGNARQELDAAAKLMRQLGDVVAAPEPQPAETGSPPRPPRTVRQAPAPAPDPEPIGTGGLRRPNYRPDDPILTGEMIPVVSSNVHSIGFIWNPQSPAKGTLKVRFLGRDRGKGRRGGGAMYHYFGVNPAVFDAFRIAASKGKFVWDRLRVRGTVSGHQFQYELAMLEKDGYVPRKATRYGDNEYYIGRQVQDLQGNTYRSQLEDEFVQKLGRNRKPPSVIAGRGAPPPNRGRPGPPNRGRPNN